MQILKSKWLEPLKTDKEFIILASRFDLKSLKTLMDNTPPNKLDIYEKILYEQITTALRHDDDTKV